MNASEGTGLPAVGPRLSRSQAFRAVCDMERPVTRVRSLLSAVRMMCSAETQDDFATMAFCETIDAGLEACKLVEDIQEKLFHGLHPTCEAKPDDDDREAPMSAPASIRLQDKIGDIRSFVEALMVFGSGLRPRDRQASAGLAVIVDCLADSVGEAEALAEGRELDDGTAS